MKYTKLFSFITKAGFAIVLILSQLPTTLYAQNFDSLYSVLRAHPGKDTTRVNALWKLAQSYENKSTDSMIRIANEGLAISKDINYEKGEALCNQSIGLAYLHLSEYDKSLEHYKISQALFEKEDNKRKLINIYLSMGDVYKLAEDYALSLSYYRKGLLIADSTGDDIWKNQFDANIADVYLGMKQYDSALQMYTNVLKLTAKIPDPLVILDACNGIGNILTERHQTNEGIKYFLRSLDVAQKNHMKQAISETARYLEESYEQVDDDKDALKYNKLYLEYRDSVYNDKSTVEIQQMQFDYELGKKETQIALLNKDKAIERSSLEKQKSYCLGFINRIGPSCNYIHITISQYPQ